jgi:hypothetical protein
MFDARGWILNRPTSTFSDREVSGGESIRVFDYLDDSTYQRMMESNARIRSRSPLARKIDAHTTELRAAMEREGLPVHPLNPRLDIAPNLHYFEAGDVVAWADFFALAAPDILSGVKTEAKYVSVSRNATARD